MKAYRNEWTAVDAIIAIMLVGIVLALALGWV